MQPTTIQLMGLVLVCFALIPLAANAQTPPEVRIKVEIKKLSDADKDDKPMPEVPLNEDFTLEVAFPDNLPRTKLTLSEFRLASYGVPPSGNDNERPSWYWDGDLGVASDGREGDENNSVEFDSASKERIKLDEHWYVVRKRARLLMDEESVKNRENLLGLIFFKIELKNLETRELIFTYDPPWVKKDPSG